MRLPTALGAILLAATATSAFADRGVIADKIPRGVDQAAAMKVVRERMTGLGWTVTGSDATSVSGTYVGQNLESRIRISVEREKISYEESATDLGAARRGATSSSRTPARWINALRSDIGRGLARAETTEVPRPPAQQKFPQTERLAELRKMRDAGLITAEEYEQKRAEILKDL